MALLKRQFHGPEQGSGEEGRYHLARDTETGQVFVLHEASQLQDGVVRRESEQVELETPSCIEGSRYPRPHNPSRSSLIYHPRAETRL